MHISHEILPFLDIVLNNDSLCGQMPDCRIGYPAFNYIFECHDPPLEGSQVTIVGNSQSQTQISEIYVHTTQNVEPQSYIQGKKYKFKKILQEDYILYYSFRLNLFLLWDASR